MSLTLRSMKLGRKPNALAASLLLLTLASCSSSRSDGSATQEQAGTTPASPQTTQFDVTSPPSESSRSGSVSISKGEDASSNCQGNADCRFVRVTIGELMEPYTISMYDNYGEWGPSGCSYSTSDVTSEYCFYGYPGSQVYVIVNGVKSNVLAW